MEQIKHFTDLEVWRKAHQLFLDILSVVDKRIEKMLASLKNKIDANPNAVRERPETYDS